MSGFAHKAALLAGGHCSRTLSLVGLLLLGFTTAVVDDAGNYRSGGSIESLAPPAPTEEDKNAAIDLSKQPIEKIFRLLAYELMREDKRPAEQGLSIRDFQEMTELECPQRLAVILQEVASVSQDVGLYLTNVTGTVGLYWLLHAYPDEHSWVWVISHSHERMLWKIGQHMSRLELFAMDDARRACLPPGFRTVLMNAAATWKRIHGDYIALLWNGIAFGMLGDVTAWRDVDEETLATADGPGGPPPNVSWSENIIFGNMWLSSVNKWMEYHKHEVTQGAYGTLARLQRGWPAADELDSKWLQGSSTGLSSFEYLRRQVWDGWKIDKGLLRGLLRYVLKPSYSEQEPPISVGDFGAGGGRYSEWLNETGLVASFAFDGTFGVKDITGGRVQEADFSQEVRLWRSFDWVMALDGASPLSAQGAVALLQNAKRHASKGFVMAWKPSEEASFVDLVTRETGMRLDKAATESVRKSCELPHLQEGVGVFRAAS
eukprot:TRINITY_DN102554_c0_g1_i1.p1 TRINITY_DN102554_c0_g1~~TRINITY_DN102554_c0_g1_i1.p1  ORF type:complete len:489 (+),score=116.04 TRINITY_DN102554_c0_g1_i1:73-1539(+)